MFGLFRPRPSPDPSPVEVEKGNVSPPCTVLQWSRERGKPASVRLCFSAGRVRV